MGFRAYSGSNGHEEAIAVSICCSECPSASYPNVAAEPVIYWPSVRIIPFGPGPYRMMFVAPKWWLDGTLELSCTTYRIWNRWSSRQLRKLAWLTAARSRELKHTSAHQCTHFYCCSSQYLEVQIKGHSFKAYIYQKWFVLGDALGQRRKELEAFFGDKEKSKVWYQKALWKEENWINGGMRREQLLWWWRRGQ